MYNLLKHTNVVKQKLVHLCTAEICYVHDTNLPSLTGFISFSIYPTQVLFDQVFVSRAFYEFCNGNAIVLDFDHESLLKLWRYCTRVY